jgi:hypothetical protein
MRPRSIIWFERAAILLLALAALQAYQKLYGSSPLPSDLRRLRMIGLAIYAVIAAAILSLVWLIARRRNTLAKWLYVALNVARLAGSILLPLAISDVPPSFPPIAWAQMLLIAISIWLLFRPDARSWFVGASPVNPEVFR